MRIGIYGLSLVAALVCMHAPAQMASTGSGELVKWNMDGLNHAGTQDVESAPTWVHSSVKSSDLSFEGFAPTVWQDALSVYANDLMTDLEGAIIRDHYYTFKVTPKRGKKISYSSIFNRLSINTGNLTTGASIKFVLMSSATGLPKAGKKAPPLPIDSFLVVHPAENDKATIVEKTFDVSGVEALQGVKDPVEFRIYVVQAAGVGNRVGYGHIFYKDGRDDLRVSGTVE